MTFSRLTAADILAMVVALALLFVMAADWYSTVAGEEARRIERFTRPQGAGAGEVSREVEERARVVAEGAEKNAWQLSDPIDRVVLGALLATVAMALLAGFLRAGRRRFEPPSSPIAFAGVLAALSALLIGYRALDQPGVDAATTVRSGVPMALVALGLLVVLCARAAKAEEDGTAWREPVASAGGEVGSDPGSGSQEGPRRPPP